MSFSNSLCNYHGRPIRKVVCRCSRTTRYIISSSDNIHVQTNEWAHDFLFRVHCRQDGCHREGGEMWRNIGRYFEDRWNIIDVLCLLLLVAGLGFRLAASSSQWGHALYALSAPLLFARILFFAQILRFQGPMIEVCLEFRVDVPCRTQGISGTFIMFCVRV